MSDVKAGAPTVSVLSLLGAIVRWLEHVAKGGGARLDERSRTKAPWALYLLCAQTIGRRVDESGIGDRECRRGPTGCRPHVMCIGEGGRVGFGAIERAGQGRARLVARSR